MKIDEKEINADIEFRVGNYKDDCLDDLDKVKAKLNTIVNNEFKRVVGDDVTELFQWKKMYPANPNPYDQIDPLKPETYYDKFLSSKVLSPEEIFLNISKYGIKEDNEQGSEKFIADIKKQKEYISKRKTELASEAKKVIDVYKRILSENQKEIDSLSAEIAKDEKIIKENNAVIQAILTLGKSQKELDPKQGEQVDKLNQENANISAKIKTNGSLLTKFIDAQKIYQVKIDKYIREFRKEYGDKAENIIEDDIAVKEATDKNTNNNVMLTNTSRGALVPNKSETEKQIAKKMLEHISSMNLTQFMDLIKENGFQDIEDAKKHLGFFDRMSLNKKLSMYIGNVPEKEEFSCGKYEKNSITGEIEYKESYKYKIKNGKILKNDGKMKYEDYNQIIKEIESFNKAITQGASYKQIEEFNKKIQYVYLIAAYNNGKRFSPFYSVQNELRNSLAEFSKLNYQIQSKVAERENKLRTVYGINPKSAIGNTIHNVNKNTPKRIKQVTEPNQK